MKLSIFLIKGGIDWGSIRLPTLAQQPAAAPAPVQRQAPSQDNPETIRQMLLADPHQLSLLKERNPRLAESINNAEEFAKV